MDADTIIHEIREALDEPGTKKNYWTNDRILSLVNNRYNALAWEGRFCRRMTNYEDYAGSTQNDVDSEADNPVHKMPSDFMTIDPQGDVTWKNSATDTISLVGTTINRLKEERLFDGNNTSGTPIYYILIQENMDYYDDAHYTTSAIMLIYPYPDAVGNKLEADYIAKPTALESTIIETSPAASATSPLFNERFHWLLVWDVVIPKLLKRRRNNDAAAVFSAMRDPLYAEFISYYRGSKNLGQPRTMRRLFSSTRTGVDTFV